jgi:hypothetical protein
MAYKNPEQVMKRIRTRKAPKKLGGKASTAWESWTQLQRVAFLRWCGLSTTQILVFTPKPWYSLNQHVRTAAKRFFRQSPTLDGILGPMRYPETKVKAAEKK